MERVPRVFWDFFVAFVFFLTNYAKNGLICAKYHIKSKKIKKISFLLDKYEKLGYN